MVTRDLYHRFIEHGPVFKLAFGPKAFIVVSDPVVVRHLLKVRWDLTGAFTALDTYLCLHVSGLRHICGPRQSDSAWLSPAVQEHGHVDDER